TVRLASGVLLPTAAPKLTVAVPEVAVKPPPPSTVVLKLMFAPAVAPPVVLSATAPVRVTAVLKVTVPLFVVMLPAVETLPAPFWRRAPGRKGLAGGARVSVRVLLMVRLWSLGPPPTAPPLNCTAAGLPLVVSVRLRGVASASLSTVLLKKRPLPVSDRLVSIVSVTGLLYVCVLPPVVMLVVVITVLPVGAMLRLSIA